MEKYKCKPIVGRPTNNNDKKIKLWFEILENNFQPNFRKTGPRLKRYIEILTGKALTWNSRFPFVFSSTISEFSGSFPKTFPYHLSPKFV